MPVKFAWLKPTIIAMAGALAVSAAGACLADNFTVIGDAIPESLTGTKGDAARGRAIVRNRQASLCLLCHSGPFPEERFQGTIGTDLDGIRARLSEGQIRLKIVDPGRVNPATVMPAYFRTDGLTRVAPAFQGKTVLTAEQIEDIVAYLLTLK